MRNTLRLIGATICDLTGPVRVRLGDHGPWWMGMAFMDYVTLKKVYYAVPLHHLVCIVWCLNHWWCRYRHMPSWVERQCSNAVNLAWEDLRKEALKIFTTPIFVVRFGSRFIANPDEPWNVTANRMEAWRFRLRDALSVAEMIGNGNALKPVVEVL